MPTFRAARSACEAFGHIARQRCRCDGTFEPEREEYARPPGGTRVVRYVHCRCLNAACREAATFKFWFDLTAPRAGWALAVEAADPLAPAATFPALTVAAQVAVHLVAAAMSYRAAAGPAADAAAVAAMAADVRAHLGLPPAADPQLLAGLAAVAGGFDAVVAALAAADGG